MLEYIINYFDGEKKRGELHTKAEGNIIYAAMVNMSEYENNKKTYSLVRGDGK